MKATARLSPSKSKFSAILLETLTAIFIILWIYTGITKLIDFRSATWQMMTNPIFRDIPWAGVWVGPSLELVAALLLVIKSTRTIGFYLSFALMLFFTFYVGYLMIFLPNLPCTCGGIISSLTWGQHLAMNIVLTILAFIGVLFQRRRNRFSTKVNA